MVKILVSAIALLLFLIALGFSAINAEAVTVDYYFGTFSLPLSLVLVAALAIGAVCGLLVGLARTFRLKREIGQLRRSMRTTEQEVRNLRALPLKDVH